MFEGKNLGNSCVWANEEKIQVLSLRGFFLTMHLPTKEIHIDLIQPQPLRYKFSSCRLNDKIIIYGGCSLDEKTIFGDVLIFDITEKNWMSFEVEFPPEPRFDHIVCMLHDFMIICGGIGKKGWLRDWHCFDLVALEWAQIETLGYIPHVYSSFLIVPVNMALYMFGVYNNNSAFSNEFVKVQMQEMVGTLENIKYPDNDICKVLNSTSTNSFLFILGISRTGLKLFAYHPILQYFSIAVHNENLFGSVKSDEKYLIPYILNSELIIIKIQKNS